MELDMTVSVRINSRNGKLPGSAECVIWFDVHDAGELIRRLLSAGCMITGGSIRDHWSRLDVEMPDLELNLSRMLREFQSITIDVYGSDPDICLAYMRVDQTGNGWVVEEINRDTGLRFTCLDPDDAVDIVTLVAGARLAYEADAAPGAVKATALTAPGA